MHIRNLLSDTTARDRLHISLCTLSFEPDSPSLAKSENAGDDSVMDDPSSEQGQVVSYAFMTRSSDTSKGRWVLSFSTSSGGPLILSQSRMKRLATAIHIQPQAQAHGLDLLALGGASMAVGPSWLDLTLDPHSTRPSRIYTSRYRPAAASSTSTGGDPELLSTLRPLSEPGLALGKIPVRNLGEALEVMKIVKEQIWLNGLLRDAMFQPGYGVGDVNIHDHSNGIGLGVDGAPGVEEAKAMYDALMNGSYVAHRLKVTCEVLGEGRTGLKASFPLNGSSVIVEVMLDRSCERGLRVSVDGERVEMLGEVVRRGGLLALMIAVRRIRIK